jgi:hypothetical protein
MTEAMSPYLHGFTACERGLQRGANPHARGSDQWGQWIAGYEAAEGIALELDRALNRPTPTPLRAPWPKVAPKVSIPIEDRDWELLVS